MTDDKLIFHWSFVIKNYERGKAPNLQINAPPQSSDIAFASLVECGGSVRAIEIYVP